MFSFCFRLQLHIVICFINLRLFMRLCVYLWSVNYTFFIIASLQTFTRKLNPSNQKKKTFLMWNCSPISKINLFFWESEKCICSCISINDMSDTITQIVAPCEKNNLLFCSIISNNRNCTKLSIMNGDERRMFLTCRCKHDQQHLTFHQFKFR